MQDKIVSAQDAAALVASGDTICTSGFVGIGVPEELLIALEQRYLETGTPRDLQLLFAAGQGDGKTRGLNHLGHSGLIKRAVGGHWGLVPALGRLALAGEIEAWNLPQGVISQLYREIAAGRPGLLTKVGLDTFVDPRRQGGRINDISTAELVRLMSVDDEDYLYFPTFPIQVALIRATTADRYGNLTMEREALILDNLAMACAARNSGGLVIAQVERVAEGGSLSPREVVVPAALVDAVVLAQPENHQQTFATPYSPYFSGEVRAVAQTAVAEPLSARKVIARRCALELPLNGVVNLGIGMPEGVAAVASEEKLLEHVTLTAEPGVIGGQPASGLDFGAAVNTDAIIAQNQQFDFYDGGGLDLAILGMAEADEAGNVNVSRFGGRLAGAGGFINISQNARKVVFAGTFTAGGLDLRIADGRLEVRTEGRAPKFVSEVEQVTFSAAQAIANGKPVLYVTERAVFRLDPEGVRLIEIAPGVDLERDVLAHMAFRPIMDEVEEMDPALFSDEPIGLHDRLFDLHLPERIALDSKRALLFLNFEGMRVLARQDIEDIRRTVEARLEGVEQRVDVVVNYDRFYLAPELADAYADMVADLEARRYNQVSRFTTSAFLKLKLGEILTRRTAPHLFESRDEAQAFLDSQSD